MDIIDIIENKKRGKHLNSKQIDFFINGAVKGSIPDYQLSALLMAIWFKGMDKNETYYLTRAMKNSGDLVDTSFINGIVADKHSTGGVSDTVTPVIVPVLASNDIKVVKMSGRGLSHTGGTIDKLESIPNFNTKLDTEQIKDNVNKCNAVIASQSKNLVPADKILYALRDVTATVDSIPLIASSIMSKKLASGADIILLDVKYGSGGFMKKPEDALKLAKAMVDIGIKEGKKCAAIISSMAEPLTKYIGCNFEMQSAINVLKGEKNDLYTVAKEICSRIFILAGKENDLNCAYDIFDNTINKGVALNKFRQIIKCQGGDDSIIEKGFKTAKYEKIVYIKGNGYITEIDAEKVGKAVTYLGGGREKKGDKIDHSTGVMLNFRLNDKVKNDDVFAKMYTNDKSKFLKAEQLLENCYKTEDKKINLGKLIYAYVDGNNENIF